MPEKIRPTREYRLKQLAERDARALEAEREALLVVRQFNARLSTKKSAGFWPTIASALNARHPWLKVLCESCDTVLDLDLRVKPRDPEASVRVALRDVRCPRCNGHGRPRIIGISRHTSG
ncbi:MAG: hypothetical protein AB7O50_12330 [Pseudolabrys sp.]